MPTVNRRTVLQGASALFLASTTSRAEAQATPVLRRSISTMPLNDPALNSYRKAVAAMKALPANDPRNWTKQAQIHLNFCPHGNWYFLPWHRAYLAAFEKLCRQMSGDNTFALPYWDWTANPQLPAAFATPTYNGQPNPLFDSTRSSQTVTIPSTYVGPSVMQSIYGETSFEVFGSSRPNGQNNTSPSWQRVRGYEGPLESTPHDHVHTTIAGNMATFMSPLDPIFWLHHCNIDRVWDQWNRIGRSNSQENIWRSFAFNNQFVVPSGAGTQPWNTTVASVLDILALGYRYTLPLLQVAAPLLVSKFINPGAPVERIKIAADTVARINTVATVDKRLAAPQISAFSKLNAALSSIRTFSATPGRPAVTPGRVLLFLRDVDPPAQGNVDVRVFVNNPDASPATSTEDRHYAGSFTFFGAEHAAHSGKPSYMLDITRVVSRLDLAGIALTDQIKVQLVPLPIASAPGAEQIKVGDIEVAIF
ncbi:MAG: tyrosinase family protein [Proteobacteria bacterium]|nr:tyrosinase family protein [Pseudomonadota bacterium]